MTLSTKKPSCLQTERGLKYQNMEKTPIEAPEGEEDNGRTSSFMGLISDAMSNTGMQGLPNVQRSRNTFRKVLWTLICLTGLGVMTWQIVLAIIKFYTYPTQTTVEYSPKTSLEFPAVTICNNNPIKLSQLQSDDVASELYSYVQAGWAEMDTGFGDNASAPSSFEEGFDDDYVYSDEGNIDDNYDYDDVSYNGEEDSDFDFVEDFIALMSKLNKSQKVTLGHQLSDMIISCTWQGKKCRSSQFTSFNNYMYGNCYTFNSGLPDMSRNFTGKTLKTSKLGPLYGFALELYIEQSEYISNLADSAGIRLIIHNQTYMPFPEDFGMSLKPGSKTSIGISRREIYRASAPHGTCIDYTSKQNRKKNAFLDDNPSVTYTVPACKKTCFQKALLRTCECFDYKVPVNDDLDAYKFANYNGSIETFPPCDEDAVFQEKQSCIQNVTSSFITNSLGCSSECHVPCFEVEYPMSESYSQWPSVASADRVANELSSKSQEIWDLLQNDSLSEVERKQWMNDNFLKLEVYYKGFDIEVVKTFPSFDALALISALGGQAGLWVGVSVIAFFELFELIFDISWLCIKFIKRKVDAGEMSQKDKVTPMDNYNLEVMRKNKEALMVSEA